MRSKNLYAICGMYFAYGYGLYFYFTWLPTYLIRVLGFSVLTWLVPLVALTPRASVLYLTVACPLLYFVPGGGELEGARVPFECAIYGPFAVLVALELWRRRAARTGISWIKGVG